MKKYSSKRIGPTEYFRYRQLHSRLAPYSYLNVHHLVHLTLIHTSTQHQLIDMAKVNTHTWVFTFRGYILLFLFADWPR